MSDILIKGRKMPNRCFECIFLTTVPNFFCLAGKRDLCAEHGINISRPDWCPLVEVPTPHGRLVDLDKMVDEYWDGSSMRIDKTDIKDIEEYDVVIEAEGETDGR